MAKREYTQAQNKATQKYVKEHCERVYITLPKGIKDSWKAAADLEGESLTEYIRKAVEMRFEGHS